MSDERTGMDDTVVTLRYTDAGEARRALHALKRLDRRHRLRVRGAALVERSAQGRTGVPAGAADDEGLYLPAGVVVVGMLVEAVSGPSEAVYGEPTESFVGHGRPSPHGGDRELALEELRRSLEPGVVLVVAEIADPDPEVLDEELAKLGGTVTQRPAEEVYAELGHGGRTPLS